MKLYLTFVLILLLRAELVIEEKIDYNDLVNSIQDETALCTDLNKITLDSGNKDAASKDGIAFLIQLIILLFISVSIILSDTILLCISEAKYIKDAIRCLNLCFMWTVSSNKQLILWYIIGLLNFHYCA